MQSDRRILTGLLFTVVLATCGAARASYSEADCHISEAEALRLPRATLFVGTLEAVAATTFVDVRVLEVFDNRLGLTSAIKGHRVNGVLASSACAKSLRVGKQYFWAATVEKIRNNIEVVLRTVGTTSPQTATDGRGNERSGSFSAERAEDPCAGLRCHAGAVCEIWNDPSRQRVGVCTCLSVSDLEASGRCTRHLGRVCASNGKLYDNQCQLLQATCLQQIVVSIVSWTAVNEADCLQQALRHAKTGASESQLSKAEEVVVNTDKPARPSVRSANPYDQPQQDATFSREVVDSLEGSACELNCNPDEIQPVCGSDGRTFLNPCLLEHHSCLSEQRYGTPPVHVQTWGYCPAAGLEDQAELCGFANICLYGGRCTRKGADGDADYDGKYRRLKGVCSCEHISCEQTWNNNPVCGDDGMTYRSECFLRRAACETQSPKKVLFPGACTQNPCLGQACSWPGELCRVDSRGGKQCVCRESCPRVVVPVCGSDGVTYDSVCHLERTACLQKKHIWVVHAGQCPQPVDECARFGRPCKGYEVCIRRPVVVNSALNAANTLSMSRGPNQITMTPQCACPICPEDGLGDNVCGTDDRTYRSECHLRAAACRTRQLDLRVQGRGPCDACKGTKCKFFSICQTNKLGEPFCTCPTDCIYTGKWVCGSDGRAYENECFLRVQSCALQKEIYVLHPGKCEECSKNCPIGMMCLDGKCVCRESCPKSGLDQEVCGTDGRIYPSVCELRRQACLQKATVKIDGSGVVCRKSPLMRNRTIEFQSDDALADRCDCNKIGSRDPYCDEEGVCRCHWGVEGRKCDRCVDGYWGISNGKPCISCSCNRFGSEDAQTCDSHSGQCKCKEGITGQQCSICPNGEPVTSKGCPEPSKVQILDDRRRKDEKVVGLFFGASTAAFIPFEYTVEADVSLHLNMTPLSANGEVFVLSFLPREGTGRRFLKLRLTDAHLEFAYVTGPNFAKMKYIVTRGKVPLGEPMAVHCVLRADESLQVTNEETGRREFGQHYHGKMINDNEYRQLVESRYGGLVVGCPSARGDQHPSCGFTGCLTGIGAKLTTPQGLERYVDLLAPGEGRNLRWIRSPEGATRCETGVHRMPAWSDQYGVGGGLTESASPPPAESARDVCQSDNPCLHEGLCQSKAGAFVRCICSPGWQGKHCEKEVAIIPEFNGKAYIRLDGPTGQQALKRRRMTLELIFTRSSNEGVILAIPPSETGAEFLSIRAEADDCVKIHLRVGRLSRFYNLPIYQWLLRKYQPRERVLVSKICSVVHSRWHNLTIDKKTRQYTVYLNGKKMDQQILPKQSIPGEVRGLRKALTSFDLSQSPLYLGGIPRDEINLKEEESIVTNNFFVGAIQKVEINGAELVLAGPHPSDGEKRAAEQWVNVSQWQGPPCGEDFASCGREPLRQICRPLGEDYTCSCSTPLQHAVFVRRLTSSLARADLSIEEQKRISAEAEELSCAERSGQNISREVQGQLGEVQHDVPEENVLHTFSQKDPPRPIESGLPIGQGADALKFRTTVNLDGSTTLKYRNLISYSKTDMLSNNLRISIRTRSENGLLLLIQNTDRQSQNGQELLALVVRNGYPEAYLGLRKKGTQQLANVYQHLTVQTTTYVSDGMWHDIQLLRNKGRVTVIVDSYMEWGELTETDGILHNDGYLLLGGSSIPVPNLPPDYSTEFTGCISAFFINEQSVDLLIDAEVIDGHVSPCQ
ncbi:hypothetical protein SprV_0301058300 [Sparganum proliferum]